MAEAGLVDRYVAAVVRAVPEQSREDVARELEASIRDQVDDRVEGGAPAADAERAVLVELGDPLALAAGYAGRPLTLIGPRYYLDWLRLLRLLLAVVLPVVTVAAVLVNAATGTAPDRLIGVAVSTLITVGVHVAFWPTLAFAILERTGADAPLGGWTPERLPAARPAGASVGELVANVVAIVVGLGAVAWDQLVGFVVLDGRPTSVLSSEPLVLAAVVLLVVLGFAPPLAALRSHGWTRGVATGNAVVAVLVAAGVITLIASGTVLSGPFRALLDAQDATRTVGVIAGAIVVVGAVWSCIDGFRRVRR